MKCVAGGGVSGDRGVRGLVKGQWRLGSPSKAPSCIRSIEFCFGIGRGQSWEIHEISREVNGTADRLVKAGIKRQSSLLSLCVPKFYVDLQKSMQYKDNPHNMQTYVRGHSFTFIPNAIIKFFHHSSEDENYAVDYDELASQLTNKVQPTWPEGQDFRTEPKYVAL
ncbi:hypothetical protein PVK06_028716 [Gossypium arboreum]|uniref:RNase H type-1 domain-containing protein n=1 Tax=Gossypium arboreum TaxID=29729 RepID=A0ABR0P4L3_GOSAR|nr:hypothetical protein PVK06_028716 [Gossypium arboreum]